MGRSAARSPALALLCVLVVTGVRALAPLSGLALALALALGETACISAPRMCVAAPDCGANAACVAGRCLRNGAIAAVTTAHRWLYPPVDVAFVVRGAAEPGAGVPSTATLGRGDGALALFRFAVSLSREATVLEAYLLLHEDADVDADPAPIALHAARVVEPWRGDAVRWALQPRLVEVGSPVTSVVPVAGRTVRIDVRELVARWRRRPEDDFGLALLAAGTSATGVALALAPIRAGAGRGDVILAQADPRPTPLDRGAHVASALDGPELELYVK